MDTVIGKLTIMNLSLPRTVKRGWYIHCCSDQALLHFIHHGEALGSLEFRTRAQRKLFI